MKKLHAAPTLSDVAKKAGVSTATVSRCLNEPDKVIERTRERVMAAVRELGYSPNFGARVMAARRTNTIGAIIPTMENAIFARAIQAFQEALRAEGFTLLVASSSYQEELEDEQIRSLVARGADGLLLIGHGRDPAIYRFLERQGIPALVTWTLDATVKRPSIGFDNRAAMHLMAQKIFSLGHRKAAMISAPCDSNDRARARVVGVKDAMVEAGLDPASLVLLETPYSIENGASAFDQLMQAPQKPSVVLCGNDVLAVGALRRARELGLNVPEDVSITGFDDIELAEIAVPALTTVHIPHREMGRRAAEMLVKMVQTGAPAHSVALYPELRLRGSLGPFSPR